jgi:tetratricopeptide (TPR) repeat protein
MPVAADPMQFRVSRDTQPIGADGETFRQAAAAIRDRRFDLAESIARAMHANDPSDPRASQVLGVSLLAQNRTREAIAALEQALADGFEPVEETCLYLGKAWRLAGRLVDAQAMLERAAARRPPFAAAFLELGLLFQADHRFDEAEAAFLRGLDASPTDTELLVELGGLQIARADPAKAKLWFARTLALDPGHARGMHGFGIALLFEGDFAQAAECFRWVLARNPHHVRARLDLGHCLIELKRWNEGMAELRGLVDRAPQHYETALKTIVRSARGRFWLEPAAALKALQGSVASIPTRP